MKNGVLQDWEANRGNVRSRMILLFFRLAQKFHSQPRGVRWIGYPVVALYEVIVCWVMGVELNHKATVGPGLKLFHGTGLVLHERTVIGAGCTLRHCTTLGMRSNPDEVPVVGDFVDIGCNSVLLGGIKIGDRAVIGAGSVVLHDVPDGTFVAGNPARPIR